MKASESLKMLFNGVANVLTLGQWSNAQDLRSARHAVTDPLTGRGSAGLSGGNSFNFGNAIAQLAGVLAISYGVAAAGAGIMQEANDGGDFSVMDAIENTASNIINPTQIVNTFGLD